MIEKAHLRRTDLWEEEAAGSESPCVDCCSWEQSILADY